MRSESLCPDDAVGALCAALREFERHGLGRPAAASLSEYLAALVAGEILPKHSAELVVSVYNARRYGNGAADNQPMDPALEALHSAARKLGALEPDHRKQIAEELCRRFTPAEPRPAVERAPCVAVPAPLPAAVSMSHMRPPLPSDIDFPPPKPGEIHSGSTSVPSRIQQRRIVLACGLAVAIYTAAILVGGYQSHDGLRTFVTVAKTRLGWDDAGDDEQLRHMAGVAEDRPRESREIESLIQRGNALATTKQTQLAIHAYEIALSIDANHALANNNLAWLLLTTQNASHRDPARALPLAQKAVEVQPIATYLDTLAEAWFQNGDPAKAVEFEEQALALEEKSRDLMGKSAVFYPPGQSEFLRKQLEKFRQAKGGPSGPAALSADSAPPKSLD